METVTTIAASETMIAVSETTVVVGKTTVAVSRNTIVVNKTTVDEVENLTTTAHGANPDRDATDSVAKRAKDITLKADGVGNMAINRHIAQAASMRAVVNVTAATGMKASMREVATTAAVRH